MARKNRGDYVPAAYDDSSLPQVGDVYRSRPAPTNPDPTGTKEYKEQRARFDARQQPQPEEPQEEASTAEPSIWGNLQKIWNFQNQPTD